MKKADPLIRTKLRLPFTRAELVTRPRLQEQIAQGLRGPLTLIAAPAGFGKTTLVASYVAGRGMPVAWLSLDKNDNQAGRFLSYLVAALREIEPTIGSEAAQLAAAQQAPPEAILTSLINDLDTAGRERALVLDDYQFISSQAVHEQVAFLLEHCPPLLHLVIVTRSDPPLPVARLRARGQTIELRAADLSFTEPEAAQFLNNVMGLRLDAGSVALLNQRTEGWIAGLQMAALKSSVSCCVRRSWSASQLPSAMLSWLTTEDLEVTRPPSSHTWNGRISFLCRWTMSESGTAITTCLLTCCGPNCRNPTKTRRLHGTISALWRGTNKTA